jgi:hypothetical protein
MLYFDCPKCNKHLRAPDDAAGTDGLCPCGATFPIKPLVELEPAPAPTTAERKTALVPSIVAAFFGSLAVIAFAFSREARREEQERLDEYDSLNDWGARLRPEVSAFPTDLDCVWLISGIVAAAMLAVAVLRAGIQTRV